MRSSGCPGSNVRDRVRGIGFRLGRAVVQAVIEQERGVGRRLHGKVELREAGLPPAALDPVEVDLVRVRVRVRGRGKGRGRVADQEGEVPVALHPGLARVVEVVVRLVVLAGAPFRGGGVPHALQRLERLLGVAHQRGHARAQRRDHRVRGGQQRALGRAVVVAAWWG